MSEANEWTYVGNLKQAIQYHEAPPKGEEELFVFRRGGTPEKYIFVRVVNLEDFLGTPAFRAFYPGKSKGARVVLQYRFDAFSKELEDAVRHIKDCYGCRSTEALGIAVHRNLVPATRRVDTHTRKQAAGAVRGLIPGENETIYFSKFRKDVEEFENPEKLYVVTRTEQAKVVYRVKARSGLEAEKKSQLCKEVDSVSAPNITVNYETTLASDYEGEQQ